jgi:hypothetical protein
MTETRYYRHPSGKRFATFYLEYGKHQIIGKKNLSEARVYSSLEETHCCPEQSKVLGDSLLTEWCGCPSRTPRNDANSVEACQACVVVTRYKNSDGE